MKDLNKMNEKDEEKILHMISDISDEPKVPNSLLPENIMNTIEAKQKSVKIERKKKAKRLLYIGTGTLATAATLFFSVAIINGTFGSRHKCTESMKGNKVTITEDYEYENVVLSNDSSREVVVQYFLNRVYAASEEGKKDNNELSPDVDDFYIKGEHLYGSSGLVEDAVDGTTSMNSSNSIGESYISESEDDSYYKNNDQVEGVVEADKVFTDGEYIYSLMDLSSVSIAKADKGDLEYISEVEFEKDYEKLYEGRDIIGNVKFYIYKDKLIVIFTTDIVREEDEEEYYDWYMSYSISDIAKRNTCVMEYDLSNISKPELVNHSIVDGEYISSRKVDKHLYLITDKYVDISINEDEELKTAQYRVEEDCIPKVNGEEIPCSCIYIPEDMGFYNNYKVITSLNISKDLELTDSAAFLSAGKNSFVFEGVELYMGKDNIYLYSRVYNRETMMSEFKSDEVKLLYNTRIWKYEYNNGKIDFKANNDIKGELLNQFSLDEKDGYLRVVSNLMEHRAVSQNGDETKITGIDMVESSSVYVLDDELNVCGSVEGIAEDEDIRSARFIGDYGYFVTFEQVDPLFVVDLSNPSEPVILDELKVTGFSEYLHMWDENLLFGVGEEADEDGRTLGFKMSMFDVSDKENIFEVNKYAVEGVWASDTYDYKNMMVAPEKSLFGLTVYKDDYELDMEDYKLGIFHRNISQTEFNVYKYEDDKFSEVISYEYESEYSLRWEYEDFEYRGLYIGDYLYVIVLDEGIQSFSLDNYEKVDFVAFD